MQKTGATDGLRGFSWKMFLSELVLYGTLVSLYFILVLHFLGDWLKHLFDYHRILYATIALALIIGQGVVLEMLTTALLKLMRWRPTWGKR